MPSTKGRSNSQQDKLTVDEINTKRLTKQSFLSQFPIRVGFSAIGVLRASRYKLKVNPVVGYQAKNRSNVIYVDCA